MSFSSQYTKHNDYPYFVERLTLVSSFLRTQESILTVYTNLPLPNI